MKKIDCFDISHRRDVVRECEGSPTLCARMGTGGNNIPIVLMDQGGEVMSIDVDKVGTLRAETHGHEPVVLSHPQGVAARIYTNGKTGTLTATHISEPVVIAENIIGRQPKNNGYVRRLTPVECERLQGFPDDYTKIPYRGKPAEQCPDTPRYKAIGNSWAIPVVQWIGKRIDDALKKADKK